MSDISALDESAALDSAADRSVAKRVVPYLQDQLGLLPPLSVRRFTGGRANLTYLVRHRDGDVVVRRPPFGYLAPRSHDMVREYRVMDALSRALRFVPRPLHLCRDASVLDAPFFVIERRHGTVIRADWPSELGTDPLNRRQASHAFLDAVVQLHTLRPDEVGLTDLGRPEGFMRRQFAGWFSRWCAAAGSDGSDVADIFDWLAGNDLPPQRATILHNDLKLDNAMYATGDPTRLVAIFDWDMCTLGDPLADIGTILSYWGEAGDDPELYGGTLPPTSLPGFLSRTELVEAYSATTGVDAVAMRVYEIYGWMKLAVIGQQLLRRYVEGDSNDHRLAAYGTIVPAVLRHTRRLITQT